MKRHKKKNKCTKNEEDGKNEKEIREKSKKEKNIIKVEKKDGER